MTDQLYAHTPNELGNWHLLVDHLIIIQYLLRHPEIDMTIAARICQRSEDEAREILSQMAQQRGYLERGGTGRGAYHFLNPGLYRELAGPGDPERFGRIEWDVAKTRILSILRQRSARREPGLTNAEIRGITHYDRNQAKRLMGELQAEGVRVRGRGRGARWEFAKAVGAG